MIAKEYKFKFYLNAKHKMKIGRSESQLHPHTWEISLHMRKINADFFQFSEIESAIQSYINKYEGVVLNNVEPFDTLNPIMENIGEEFFKQLSLFLPKYGWCVEELEISENPTRTYIIRKGKYGEDFGGFYAEDQADISCVKLYSEAANEEKELIIEVSPENIDSAGPVATAVLEAEEPHAGEIRTADRDLKREEAQSFGENAQPVCRAFTESKDDAKTEYGKRTGRKFFVWSIVAILMLSVLLIFWITQNGFYPWGSDSWGHIFKAKLLYEHIASGKIFPLYTDLWYNGVQPFRYWAPLPYYFLASMIALAGGSIAWGYNFFIGFLFIAGALGWLFWGKIAGRLKFGMALALIWFFVPDNLRVLFSEGNLPRGMVAAIFPYLMCGVWEYFERRTERSALFIVVSMFLITLSHAMISAMAGITLFVFAIWYGIENRKIRQSFQITLLALIGIALSGVWLYPALKGGIMAMDAESVRNVMKELTFSITSSLNPFIRSKNPEAYYFGLSFMVVAMAGMLFAGRGRRAGFGVAILVLLGTTKEFLPIIVKIPMSQLLWMIEFTPLAMGALLGGLLLWRNINRKALLVFMLAIILDCSFSFKHLCFDRPFPYALKETFDKAAAVAVQRVAVLDRSTFGSFPGYYLSSDEETGKTPQVFGWAWQGAKTSQNLVWINTAISKKWYGFLLDRCMELGADTLIVKKDVFEDLEGFLAQAFQFGYEFVADTYFAVILKYPVHSAFATKVEFECLGIGKYAENLAYIFPKIEVGSSIYVDDYRESELMKYKALFLSGFKYRNRIKAENLVKSLSLHGIKVIVDFTDIDADLYTSRPEFLGVAGQPVMFRGGYPVLEFDGKKIEFKERFPEEYSEWRTFYLENLDKAIGKADFNNQSLNYLGSTFNDNITFIGFNLPFYAMSTKDEAIIEMLEKLLEIKPFEVPERRLVRLIKEEDKKNNRLLFKMEEGGAVVPFACIDAFVALKGEMSRVHNLICANGSELELGIEYPYLSQGIALSVGGFIALAAFCLAVFGTTRKEMPADADINNIKAGGSL